MDVHIEEERIRNSSVQCRELHEVWTAHLLLQRPSSSHALLGFTKTLQEQVVSATRLYQFLHQTLSRLSFPGGFSLEGLAYRDLHAHGFVWVPSGDEHWMHQFKEQVEGSLTSSIAGFVRVEWIRDAALWFRYITKQVLTNDLDYCSISV